MATKGGSCVRWPLLEQLLDVLRQPKVFACWSSLEVEAFVCNSKPLTRVALNQTAWVSVLFMTRSFFLVC